MEKLGGRGAPGCPFCSSGMVTVPLSGHHGTAASYDSSKKMTVTGKVTEFWRRNPHSALFIDVTDEKGRRRELVGRDQQPLA